MSARAVLIMGGTGVLGGEIVRRLAGSTSAEAGAAFVILANFRRSQERARRLQAETGCALCLADAGDEAQMSTLFSSLPPLFAVVHAVGVARDALLLRQTRADWDETLRVNVGSAFLVARLALEKLEDGGRLVFLASRVGEAGNAGQCAYAASKAGVLALMKCAAQEGASRRLAVNAVCPGFVPSDLNAGLNRTVFEAARSTSVFGEVGSAVATASLVQWLLSEEAAKVSGQIFHADSRI